MKVIQTKIKGLAVFEPTVWKDERGYFFESYNGQRLADAGFEYNWMQDNEAFSSKGVLRGLHYQREPYGQTKLVRVVSGEVLDVAVDLRKDSSTYGQSFSVILSGKNKKQLLVPRGFAHGYVVLSSEAYFLYKVDNIYKASAEVGIRYDDRDLKIDWILPNDQLILSDKDRSHPSFANHIPFAHG